MTPTLTIIAICVALILVIWVGIGLFAWIANGVLAFAKPLLKFIILTSVTCAFLWYGITRGKEEFPWAKMWSKMTASAQVAAR